MRTIAGLGHVSEAIRTGKLRLVRAKAASRVSPVAIRRALYADRWVPRYRAALQRVLNKQVRQIASESLIGAPDVESHITEWATILEREKNRWVYAIVLEGYELAGAEVTRLSEGKVATVLGKADAPPPPPPPPVDLGRQEGGQFLLRGDFDSIDRWVETTSLGEAQTSASKLEKIWKDAVASRDPETGAAWTPDQISKTILRRGLVGNRHRADMLARTGAIWSVNEGAQQRYRAAGVKAERWLTTKDDALCPYCAGMDGQVVRIDEPFWNAGSEYSNPKNVNQSLKLPFEVQHPPLHPRCRCSLIPVIDTIDVPTLTPAPEIRKPARGVARKPRKPKKPKPKPRITLDIDSSVSRLNEVLPQTKVNLPQKRSAQLARNLDEVAGQTKALRVDNAQLDVMMKGDNFNLRSIHFSSKRTLKSSRANYGIYGEYDESTGVMRLGQGTKASSTLRPVRNKWLATSDSAADVYRHELGHAVQPVIGRHVAPTPLGQRFGGDKSWSQIYGEHPKNWWNWKVSQTAGSNMDEAFAECFAVFTHPEYGINVRLPSAVEEYFTILLKG